MPVFSVVVTSYGNAQYLSTCLESLLGQAFQDWEVVVVDDASCDGSLEILREYAGSDSRIIPFFESVNVGLHCARKDGVEKASGRYVLFLDPDDTLTPDALSLVYEALESRPADILHFGINVSSFGVSEEGRLSFEEYINKPCRDLAGAEIARYAFDADLGFVQDWRVTQRVYASSLIKKAFSAMTDSRLERAEDCYEYFVIANLASYQVTRNDIIALNYNYGRGVTGESILEKETFMWGAASFRKCIEAINQYAAASSNRGYDLAKLASDAKSKLMDLLFNDWSLRLTSTDKLQSAAELGGLLGHIGVAVQIMRCIRDRSYEILIGKRGMGDLDELLMLQRRAEAAFISGIQDKEPEAEIELYKEYLSMAESHLNDIKREQIRHRLDDQPIRIFVSSHKPVDLFDSEILQPVQVGCESSNKLFPWALHDNDGENISSQNPMYCELTAQYWAWKNIDAEYYGFCHYRRYFNFSSNRYEENAWGEVMEPYIDAASQKKYGLDDEEIKGAIEGYDVVTTEVKDLRKFPGAADTPLQQYKDAEKLDVDDLYHVFAILEDMHPDYAQDIESFANGNSSCFCNMFVMKRQLFFDYCGWLFPILQRFVSEWDCSLHSKEGLRTPGHLAERLLNIYLMHAERIGVNLKCKEVQCVHFECPDKRNRELPVISGYTEMVKPIIPVVFAADNNYVPMLTTTIESMMQNASQESFYDVVVIEDGISGANKDQMSQFFAKYPNMALRFFGAGALIDGYDLTTSNEHISKETYYRFLIQDVLPYYDKVLYLDSDLIIEGDVSELFNSDLGSNLLAAAHDVDYMGNLNMHDGKRMEYTKKVLKMEKPFDYFQAGVLVLNTDEMRKLHTVPEWLDIASNPDYIYNDQDILNAHCQGRVAYLGYEWNVMHDCGGRVNNVFSFAPAAAFDAYNASRSNPKVIHYAGFEKPWTFPECDFAEHYWKYARNTPFYEKLLSHIHFTGEVRPPKAIGEGNPIRKIADPLMPLGTRRREVAKSIVRTVRGRN